MAAQDDTTFEYSDASGQVTKETTKLTDNKNVVKTYEYDSAGNKSAFGVKVGDDTKLSLNYNYDGASRLISVIDEKGNEAVSYAYDTDGNLTERKVAGNSLTSTYTYDYQNRLTAMKNHIEVRNQTKMENRTKAGNQTKAESRTGSDGVISEYNAEYLANGQKSKETVVVTGKDGRKNTKT